MAIKVDLNEVVSSTSKFCFDFHFFKMRGLADIPAKEFFLAMQEIEVLLVKDPLQAVLNCMTKQELEEYKDSIKNQKLLDGDEELGKNAYAVPYLAKFMLKNNIPSIPSIEGRLKYSFVALEAKYLNICVNSILQSAIDNDSLSFDFVESTMSHKDAEKFVADVKNLTSVNAIAQLLFLYCKKDYNKIYDKLLSSIVDFFQLAK